MAEGTGFEPAMPLQAYLFSRQAHSTTLPPLLRLYILFIFLNFRNKKFVILSENHNFINYVKSSDKNKLLFIHFPQVYPVFVSISNGTSKFIALDI